MKFSQLQTKVVSIILALLLNSSFSLKAQNFNNISETTNIFQSYGDDGYGAGISFADFNNDGWDDLTLGTIEGDSIYFFINQGGHLTLIEPPIVELGDTKQILWVDYDNDGDKDLFVSNAHSPNKFFQNDGNFNFNDVAEEVGLKITEDNSYGAIFSDINNDGWLDLYITNYEDVEEPNAEPNRLYLNNGGTFDNITISSNIDYPPSTTLTCSFTDFDKDGFIDLYVSEDRSGRNKYFRNNGDITFQELGLQNDTGLYMDSMNAGIGDPNNDGLPDIYISNRPTGSNILGKYLENQGNHEFIEKAAESNILLENRVGWSGNFFDYDNDGYEDLYVSAENSQDTLRNSLYINQGTGYFEETFILGDTLESFTNAIGDIDNDGRLDIAVCRGNFEPFSLWKNNESNDNNFIKIKLTGTTTNKDAIGSEIQVWCDGNRYTRWVTCGDAYLAQNSNTKHFGIGDAEIIDSLKINWLGNPNQTFYDVLPNTTYLLEQNGQLQTVSYNQAIACFNANQYNGCNEATISFQELTNSNITSWEWQFENGTPAISTAQNPTVTYNTPGLHDVTLIVTNTLGSDTLTSYELIEIIDTPVANFSYMSSNNVVGFTNESIGASNSILWDFGDGIGTSQESNPLYIYNSPGTYEATLIISNNCSIDTITQTVNAFSAPQSGFTANTQAACTADTINFTDMSEGIIDTWFWEFEGGIPSTSATPNPIITYAEAGTYSVTLTTSNAQGQSTTIQTNFITIIASPQASIELNQNNLTLQITNNTTNLDNIIWDFGDGQTTQEASPTHTYTQAGNYTISAMLSNDCGATTWQQTIAVTQTPNFISDFEMTEFPNISSAYGNADIPIGGLSFKDFDQDGLDDLTFCTNASQKPLFYRNTGDGFEAMELVNNQAMATHATWVDYDNDGDQDLYLTNWEAANYLYQNDGNLNLVDVTDDALLSNEVVNTSSAAWADFDRDGWLDLYVANYDSLYSNFIFRNNGDGTFFDFTTACGATDTIKPSYSTGFFDMNNNGLPDLYTTEDNILIGNGLFKNLDFNTYEDIGPITGTNLHLDAHGLNIVDINQDGLLDFHFTTEGSRNQTFINQGNEQFINEDTNIGNGLKNDWGSVFLDMDNDGDEDLYTVTTDTAFHNAFFIKNNEMFEASSALAGDTLRGHAVAKGDWNNDGRIDLVVQNQYESASTWLNQNINNLNYLKVHLTGTVSNRDGIGAWVEIYINGTKQIRYTTSNDGFRAQNSQYIHFGLGEHQLVDSLKINWPSGIEDVWQEVAANQTLFVVENTSPINPIHHTTDTQIALLLYPTQVNKTVSLNMASKEYIKTKAQIINTIGQVAMQFDVVIQTGNNILTLDVDSLPKGAYYLNIAGESRYFTKL